MTYSISAPSTVNEADGTVTFTVTRSGSFPAETIYASTLQGSANGYATNSSDYATNVNNLAVAFSAGQTSRTVTVSITNDTVVESNETFGFIVQRNSSDPVSTFLASRNWTVVDNDTDVSSTFSMTPASTSATEGDGSIIFTITRTSSTAAETVYFSTLQNQGSSNNSDYGGITNKAVVFAAGITSKTVSVVITNNTIAEGTETFGAIIENAAGASLDASTFTITDNDVAPPSISAWTRPVGFAFIPLAGSPVITQGVGGDFSHDSANGQKQYYWVDFAAATGTQVRGSIPFA